MEVWSIHSQIVQHITAYLRMVIDIEQVVDRYGNQQDDMEQYDI